MVLFIVAGAVTAQTLQNPTPSDSRTNQNSVASPTVVLEVAAEYFDIAWSQEYLYVRVLSDGTTECQTMKRKAGDMRFEKADTTSVKRVLPETELKSLQALLGQQAILQLQPLYRQRIADVLDAGTVWDITIPRQNQTQKIRLVAFAPDEARTLRRPYTNTLLTLGCTVEKLRAETIGANRYVADECRKVLAAR